jgi:hypothetical protein
MPTRKHKHDLRKVILENPPPYVRIAGLEDADCAEPPKAL